MKLKNKILYIGQYLYHKVIGFIPWHTATWDKFDTTSPLWSVGYVCSNCNFISADKLKRCPECKARMKVSIKNNINQDSLMLKNTVKFATLSFNLEKDRENSIKEYSNQIIFSCAATSLIAVLEYYITGSTILWWILFINILSISPAVLSQWRFKYETMITGEEFESAFCTNKKDYLRQSDYDYQMIYQLTRVQNSKKENNNKRVFFVKIAAGILLLSIWILCIINIFIAVK